MNTASGQTLRIIAEAQNYYADCQHVYERARKHECGKHSFFRAGRRFFVFGIYFHYFILYPKTALK